jgi:hypothetical protein
MTIEYALYPNPLTDNPEHQRAVIQNQESCTIEDIIDEMISQGSSLTRAEALANIESYEAAITKFVGQGRGINTPLMRIAPSIAGNFMGTDDYFDASRHEVKLNLSPGKRLQEALEEVALQKVVPSQRKPRIQTVTDFSSDTSNSQLTPGGVIEVRGKLLKHDPDEEEQGLFFIASDGSETRASSPIRNKPSSVYVSVPDELTAGEYTLEVRVKLRFTTTIRRDRLDTSLTV